MTPAETPTETAADRCYRLMISPLHLMLQAMRRGQMPEQAGIYPEMVSHMLREAADRLDAARTA